MLKNEYDAHQALQTTSRNSTLFIGKHFEVRSKHKRVVKQGFMSKLFKLFGV